MMFNLGFKKSMVFFLMTSGSIFYPACAFAKKQASKVPAPDKQVLEAQKMVTPEQIAMYEPLPLEESTNNGYWWNRQDRNTKFTYVKDLIGKFKLEDKKLSVKKIVQALDSKYSPKDDPLDIKIDKSIERMFNIVTREMLK